MSQPETAKNSMPRDEQEQNPLVLHAKDLLTLADQDRRAAEEAFEKLGFDAQSETALALQGDDLQEWLLLSSDCTDLVRALPPEHLHQAIKLIGEEDALALLAGASSAQMQALMDIEWFTEGQLDRRKVRKWIELLMTLNEDEADEAMQGLDPNALALFLKKYVQPKVSRDQLLLAIHMQQHYLFTPDDLDTHDDLIERFLTYLYAVDRDLFGEVLELIVAEDDQILEADTYGGREDRLIKRGFPVLAKAEHLLETLNVAPYGVAWPSLGAAKVSGSTEIMRQGPAAPFLLSVLAWARAKGEMGERTERVFIKEAAELSNSLLIAHAKNPGEPNVKRDALAAVQVLASVGLEAVSHSNVITATEQLKALELTELFRIGWSLTRYVTREAWALAGDPRLERPGLGRDLKWLSEPLRAAVLEAELLMSWREIAATMGVRAEGETVDEDEEAEEPEITDTQVEKLLEESAKPNGQRKYELLTWPRLCRLKQAVDRAKEEFDKKL